MAGSVMDASGNISFGNSVAPGVMAIDSALSDAPAVLVELSGLAVVDVTISDDSEFLQKQVCNDLTALAANQAQLNGYCSPKGRLLALFTVFDLPSTDGADAGNNFRLVLPADVAPALIKRLQMFVLRAQVTITHRTDLVCTGLALDSSSGQSMAAWASLDNADAFPALPESQMGLSQNDSVQILRWHDDPANQLTTTKRDRYLCIGPHDTLFTLWQNEHFSHAAWPFWRWGDINAGVPNVFAASADQFIPQMLNMQLIDAVSFKKGCFPGQEIVARMQYLGKLKKHMKHLHQPGVTVAPEPATTLTTESNNNAGQVVDAVVDEHGLNLLAVVNIETSVDELLLAGEHLQEAQLPYSLLPEVTQSESPS